MARTGHVVRVHGKRVFVQLRRRRPPSLLFHNYFKLYDRYELVKNTISTDTLKEIKHLADNDKVNRAMMQPHRSDKLYLVSLKA